MKRHQGILFVLALTGLSSSWAEETVNLHGTKASSSDILNSFLKATPKTENSGGVKFRSIRMKKEPAVPKPAVTDGCGISSGAVSLQITFSSDSYSLEPEGYKALDEMAVAMTSPQLKNCRFVIEGHTDASGQADYNRSLSERRASTVKNFLVYKNINAEMLTTAGLGEDRPLLPNEPFSPENRRVEFRLIPGKNQ